LEISICLASTSKIPP